MKKFILPIWLSSVLVCLLFFLFSVIFLFPLIVNFNTKILGGRVGDNIGVLSSYSAYKNGGSKFINGSKDYSINYPFGIKNTNKTLLKIDFALQPLLKAVKNEVIIYNLLIFFSFPLAGLSLYYLIYYITRHHLASMLLGLAYLMSPYHFIRSEGHLSLVYTCWLPFFVLALLMFKQKQNFWRLLFILFSWGTQFIFDRQYAFFALIFSFIFIAVWLFDNSSNQKLIIFLHRKKMIFSFSFLCLILVSIFGFSFIRNKLGMDLSRPIGDLWSYSARPFEYILPSPLNPILGGFTENFFLSPRFRHSVMPERIIYLGIVPLTLAGYSVYQWRKKRKTDDFWKKKDFLMKLFLISLLAGFIISMPPPVSPSFLIYKILPQLRVYSRLVVIVMISLYVLAGIGFSYILKKVKPKKQTLIFSMALILIILEFMPTYTLTNVREIPQVYQWLKNQADNSVIIEYPYTFVTMPPSYTYFFYQQYHGKRMVNGAPNDTEGEYIRRVITDITDPKIIPYLRLLGVDYVIFHSKEYGVIYEPYPDSKLPPEQNLPIGINYSKINPKLTLISVFEEDYVYKIMDEN